MSQTMRAIKNSRQRFTSLCLMAGGILSIFAPAALADYAECLGGARQTDTLRNPLVQGVPSGRPGQIAYGAPPLTPGDGHCAPGVVPGDAGRSAPVVTGYSDRSHGSFFPAGGSQGAKVPYGYVPGGGRYPTQSGYQQGMYDYGQGARYGSNTYEPGSSNAGMGTYEPGWGNYGQRSFDWGQGIWGQQTYQGAWGSYGQRTYEQGGKLNGMPTYDSGAGNYGQRSYDWGQGLSGQGTYQGAAGNYGQRTYEQGAELNGMPTYDSGAGNGGARSMDNGGGGYGQRMYDSGAPNGGTQLYSGRSRGGGSRMYDSGAGNGGARVGDGGAGNGGSMLYDNGTGNGGARISNEGGTRQGAAGTSNSGGPRSDANQTNDNAFAHDKQGNNYDFQGPLPTVRTFSRYLVILGVVIACVWVAMAAISVVMGNRNGPERVIGAVAGLLLLLAGYTIWKIVQMNTFKANTTGVWSNTRGEAQQRQQNGPVNPPQNFAPPEDPGMTQEAPKPSSNQIEQRQRTGPNNYRPTNSQAPRMTQGPFNYRPQGPYTGHPQGPDRVNSYDIPSTGAVPEPPEQPVINPNR